MVWSNCYFEALKQKIIKPSKVIIHKRGKWSEVLHKKFPHFYWYDKDKKCFLHFCAKFTDEPFLYQLWFQGEIREFYYHQNK